MTLARRIRVEFFGIVRTRADTSFLEVEAASIADAIDEIANHLPDVARLCFDDGRVRPGFLINLNGKQFTNDTARKLCHGDCLLLMSNDAGG